MEQLQPQKPQFNVIQKENTNLFERLVEKFGLPLDKLVPLLRIITIQILEKRYDTYFFGIFLNDTNILALNIGNFQKLKTLEKILISEKSILDNKREIIQLE